MKVADFRVQSTNSLIETPTAGVVSVFIDVSGRLLSKDENGVIKVPGVNFTGFLVNTQISTGLGSINTGIAYGIGLGTGLGTPARWLPVQFGATTYAIPAYTIV